LVPHFKERTEAQNVREYDAERDSGSKRGIGNGYLRKFPS
jgi:hypothetical protein